jgi:hypothetical protein
MGRWNSYWEYTAWRLPATVAHPRGGVLYGNGELGPVPADLVPVFFNGWIWRDAAGHDYLPGDAALLGGHLEYEPGGRLLYNTSSRGWRDVLSSGQIGGFIYDPDTNSGHFVTPCWDFNAVYLGLTGPRGRPQWRIECFEVGEPGWVKSYDVLHEDGRVYNEWGA